MGRTHRYAALTAIACILGQPTAGFAQDSFFQRFIRAGAPPPVKAPPPSIRRHYQPPSYGYRDSYGSPSRPTRRVAAPSRDTEEPIKAKVNPSTAILVLGDALAEKLAEGIDQEFADNPDVQIIRKTKSISSLTRTDVYDWTQGARAAVAGPQHIDVAVVLIGINDWQPIQNGAATLDPGSDAWREAYGRRVDAVLAALKEKAIPVVWVGLPVMRLPKLSEQLESLNALVREHVQAQGGVFVDLHGAFVGEDGKYSDTGPAMNGALVKLRTGEGVGFTKAGAIKAAYFADVEVKRILAARPPVEPKIAAPAPAPTPSGPAPVPAPLIPSTPDEIARLIDHMAEMPPAPGAIPVIARLPERPLVGPVISLTAPDRAPGGLLTAPAAPSPSPPPPSFGGEQLRAAKAGRADDFNWKAQP